jgi:hypothetical protein
LTPPGAAGGNIGDAGAWPPPLARGDCSMRVNAPGSAAASGEPAGGAGCEGNIGDAGA